MNQEQFTRLGERGRLRFFPRSARYFLKMYAKERAEDWQPLYKELLREYQIKTE